MKKDFYLKIFSDALERCEYYLDQAMYFAEQIIGKRFSCHTLTGTEKNSGAPINILYVGEDDSLDYLKDIFFQNTPEDHITKHFSLLQALRGIRPETD